VSAYRPEIGDGAGVVARLLAGACHRQEERGAEGLALGERPRLGEQRIGPLGIGRDRRLIGREKAIREPAIHLGEAVLAIAGEQAFGLIARQGLGRGEFARGDLDGRQLRAGLGGPTTPGRRLEGRRQDLAGGVEPARESEGHAPDDRDVGLHLRGGLGPIGQGRERLVRVGIAALLHGRDDLGRQLGSGRLDGLACPGRGPGVGGPGDGPEPDRGGEHQKR
jgi:hypothetical protein